MLLSMDTKYAPTQSQTQVRVHKGSATYIIRGKKHQRMLAGTCCINVYRPTSFRYETSRSSALPKINLREVSEVYDPSWVNDLRENLQGEMLLQPKNLTDQELDDWLMGIK